MLRLLQTLVQRIFFLVAVVYFLLAFMLLAILGREEPEEWGD